MDLSVFAQGVQILDFISFCSVSWSLSQMFLGLSAQSKGLRLEWVSCKQLCFFGFCNNLIALMRLGKVAIYKTVINN